jgi:hypothetical protein
MGSETITEEDIEVIKLIWRTKRFVETEIPIDNVWVNLSAYEILPSPSQDSPAL